MKKYWKHLVYKSKASPPQGESGPWGEVQAAIFLKREKHFRILARNWRNPRDRRQEIDLVARDRELLVFVEVRTRRAGARIGGFDSLSPRKFRALRRSCRSYLNLLPERPAHWRFDVVEVRYGAGMPPQILHFANVPLFS